jgi:hypothetical protein
MRYLLLLSAFLFFSPSFAQEEEDMGQRFFLGINVGVKFANKNFANRYGGWYQDQLRTALSPDNFNVYNAIFEYLGQKHFALPADLDAFPDPNIVRYQPGLVTGATVGYKLSPNLQMSLDANFNKLRVLTGYSVEVFDPSLTISQEQYQPGIILGEESRFNGRFNVDYIINDNPLNYIIGINGLFHAWRMDQHVAYFPDEFGMQIPFILSVRPHEQLHFKNKWNGLGIRPECGYRI